MSLSHIRISIRLAIVTVMLAIITGCGRPAATKSGTLAQPVRRVEVVRPERRNVQRSVGQPGQLQAYETTAIHAKIAGYVKNWTVNIGSEIKKGQVLAELYVPEIEADVQEKLAAVEQAEARKAQAASTVKVAQATVVSAGARVTEVQAGIKRAEADLTRWQREYSRIEQLFNDHAQTGTLVDETRSKVRSAEATADEVRAKVRSAEAALSESQAELDKARSDVVAAAASIDVARSEVRHAEAMLGYAKIEAPYDGIIIRRNVDSGQLTRPGSDAPPLFIAARTDIITIVIDLPEMYATDVNPGDSAIVKLQAIKGRTSAGKVTRTAWALDSKTRTIRTEIDIPNPGGKLRPGLYAYATVIVEEHKDVITIPATAVVPDKDKPFCAVVVDGKVARKRIEIGLSDGIWSEVTSGLDGSEVVVKANAASLSDGQPVMAHEDDVPATRP